MQPFDVRATDTTVEVWSGFRIQFDRPGLPACHTLVKAELKKALSGLAIPEGAPFAGYYHTTDPTIVDTENSLFTNLPESMPRGVTSLRFERSNSTPPASPVPIDLIRGHLHYYRYQVGGQWTAWEPGTTLARWDRCPRRLSANGSARPVWFALRDAHAHGRVDLPGEQLEPGMNFGLRLTVHATRTGPHNAISYCEQLVDGTIAAFHGDRYSDVLLSALAPKFPGVTDEELRRALDHPLGPLFATPAIRTKSVQFSPADDRCIVGEVTIRQEDSTGRWPELSGELFTIRPKTARCRAACPQLR
jgi:hypothetical protein